MFSFCSAGGRATLATCATYSLYISFYGYHPHYPIDPLAARRRLLAGWTGLAVLDQYRIDDLGLYSGHHPRGLYHRHT